MENLERWENFFDNRQIFIGFFEQIQHEPEKLLLNLFEFLGVRVSSAYVSHRVTEKVGAGGYTGIPDRYLALLADRNLDQIMRLHERFGNDYTGDWLDYATRYKGLQ